MYVSFETRNKSQGLNVEQNKYAPHQNKKTYKNKKAEYYQTHFIRNFRPLVIHQTVKYPHLYISIIFLGKYEKE